METREVSVNIEVSIDDIIEVDYEGFLDLISEEAGEPLLMDIGYKVVGVRSEQIIIKVTGVVEIREDD